MQKNQNVQSEFLHEYNIAVWRIQAGAQLLQARASSTIYFFYPVLYQNAW